MLIRIRMRMKAVKVTDRYQVTIPREVREQVRIRPGMVVWVEARGKHEIVIRVPETVDDPLRVLVGRRPLLKRHLPVEELERLAES